MLVGNSVTGNSNVGIMAGSTYGASVIGNGVMGNSGLGLQLFGASGYANNVVSNNNGGNTHPQTSGGVSMGTNVCRGTTTCP